TFLPPALPVPSPLALHDALPIYRVLVRSRHCGIRASDVPVHPPAGGRAVRDGPRRNRSATSDGDAGLGRLARVVPRRPHHLLLRSEEHTSELQSRENLVCRLLLE